MWDHRIKIKNGKVKIEIGLVQIKAFIYNNLSHKKCPSLKSTENSNVRPLCMAHADCSPTCGSVFAHIPSAMYL